MVKRVQCSYRNSVLVKIEAYIKYSKTCINIICVQQKLPLNEHFKLLVKIVQYSYR